MPPESLMQSENKFSWQRKREEENPGGNNPADKVMFGGCGVFYGPIRRPAENRARPAKRTIWSLFGIGRKKDIAEGT
jgi:hypothetical protein